MNNYQRLYFLGATNTESDLSVRVGIEHHIKQLDDSNIEAILKICDYIEDNGTDSQEYIDLCKSLGLEYCCW